MLADYQHFLMTQKYQGTCTCIGYGKQSWYCQAWYSVAKCERLVLVSDAYYINLLGKKCLPMEEEIVCVTVCIYWSNKETGLSYSCCFQIEMSSNITRNN